MFPTIFQQDRASSNKYQAEDSTNLIASKYEAMIP